MNNSSGQPKCPNYEKGCDGEVERIQGFFCGSISGAGTFYRCKRCGTMLDENRKNLTDQSGRPDAPD